MIVILEISDVEKDTYTLKIFTSISVSILDVVHGICSCKMFIMST